MGQFSDHGVTPQVEMLYLGCVSYSIAAWREFKYDYWEAEHFPEPGELPETDGIVLGSVIKKCFNREYLNMEALGQSICAVVDDD